MNVTLTLDDQLVKKVRKIAVEQDTTLTGLVRSYLERVAAEDADSDRKRREHEALEKTFGLIKIDIGERTWTRDELHERGSRLS